MSTEELFKPRAAAYNRQSEKVDEGMDRQDLRIRELASRRGIPVLRSFWDNDVSASKDRGDKTQWQQLLAAIKSGEINTVISVDMDRLVRRPKDLITLIDLGARVLTVDGEIDLTTADGEFRAMMLASIARFEVRRKAERQVRANQHRAMKGEQTKAAWTPFGYAEDQVTLIPEQAKAIRDGAEMYLAGVHLGAIARAWNEAGFRTNHGRPFERQTVKVILKNPRYAGMVTYKAKVIAQGVGKPIIEPEMHEAILAKLKTNSRAVPRGTVKHLLVGILTCGVCQSTMRIGYQNTGSENRTYRCPSGHVVRPADEMERTLSSLVVRRLSEPDAHKLLRTSDVLELGLLRDERQSLAVRQSSLVLAMTSGGMDPEAFNVGLADLAARMKAVDEMLAQAARADVLAPIVGAPDVAAAWEALGVERQRVIFERLFTVEVKRAGRGYRGGLTEQQLNVTWLD